MPLKIEGFHQKSFDSHLSLHWCPLVHHIGILLNSPVFLRYVKYSTTNKVYNFGTNTLVLTYYLILKSFLSLELPSKMYRT